MLCAAVALVLAVLALPLGAVAEEGRIEYPSTRRVNQVDVYHGVKVADPYRWLEADVRHSPEVAAWVAAENQVTNRYLETIPERAAVRRRLTEIWNFAQYSSPMKEGGRYYYFKNDGLQNQAVLYVMDSLDGQPRVLLDPNRWSKDGTIALAGLGFSDDGRYMAYARSEAGSDWSTWHVMEIAKGRLLGDELKWTKFSDASWTKDGKGFFYSRYEEPRPGAEFQALNFNNKVYYHRVGTPQAADALVYWRPDHPEWQYEGTVSDDGRWLVISVMRGTDERQRILVRDLAEPYAMPVELVDNFEHEYTFVGNDGPLLFFKTDLDAPRRRLVAIDLRRPQPANWKEIIPQNPATLPEVTLVGDRFIAQYLQDVASRVKVFSLAGAVRPRRRPAGHRHGHRVRRQADRHGDLLHLFQHRHAAEHLSLRPRQRRQPADAPGRGEVQAGGLRGQAGLLSQQGRHAGAHVRRRQERHPAGRLASHAAVCLWRLQYLAVADVLDQPGGVAGDGRRLCPAEPPRRRRIWRGLAQGGHETAKSKTSSTTSSPPPSGSSPSSYTRPDKLAIQGGSNGGLLVGAVMTQRPDLFGACLPAVGVMDMLRFQKFTEGRLWVDDYGSADNPEQFKALLAYSPYHNIRPGTRYPATLVTTADTDDRVIPGHSFKFIAALQHAQAGPAPVLIRISVRAGHGLGKPVSKLIDEITDLWTFLVKNLDMKLPWQEKSGTPPWPSGGCREVLRGVPGEGNRASTALHGTVRSPFPTLSGYRFCRQNPYSVDCRKLPSCFLPHGAR